MCEKNYYKITMAYDGRNYVGWQIQINGPSIHAEIMKAGSNFLEDGFTITGCSRTDSGVHALGYVALLVTDKNLEERRVAGALNAYLPKDIIVHEVKRVTKDFHPRYTSKNKHYRYTIYNNNYPIPQFLHYAHYYYKELDVEAMSKAASAFVGTHDFVGFSSIKTSVEDTVRIIDSCQVTSDGRYIHIDIVGNGFLYNMVRIIAGSLIEVGIGKIKAEDMADIIASKDRNKANKTAPACGLTLVGLEYL